LSGDDLCGFFGWRKPGHLRQLGLPSLGTQSDLPAAAEFSAPGVLAADSEGIMKSAASRHPRLRLDHNPYRGLCKQVLQRDGWRCQRCGSSQDLQVHHRQPRSLLGGDVEENLITLCSVCHREIHLRAETLAQFDL
jgi:HNH endonuclease